MYRIIYLCVWILFCVSGMGQATGHWKSNDKQIGVPTRGVQLIWECSSEPDVIAYIIYRRAMDHRVHSDLTDVAWEKIGTARARHVSSGTRPASCYYKDHQAQVSVTYEYKLVALNSSNDESEAAILKISVLNDLPPQPPKNFRLNGFDPMPQE
jgi:hypothetical protein